MPHCLASRRYGLVTIVTAKPRPVNQARKMPGKKLQAGKIQQATFLHLADLSCIMDKLLHSFTTKWVVMKERR